MSKTLATSYFMQSHANADSARKELYQQGIKTSYNEDVMIFSTLHTARSALQNPYIQECNGLVLEQKSWRPLVVPPRTLRNNIDTDASNRFLHQGLYHIYKVQDGTCFNLYYYNGKWVMSTARGHSMNDVKWSGEQTYQSIVSECLEKIGLTWDTFTSQLNQKHCYSFGFRHPLMQKFREGAAQDIYRLWFIQSVCLDENDAQYLWSSDACPIAIIPSQEVYPTTVGNFRELYKKASSALQDFTDTKEVCYGFILRSVNVEQTGEHSDLFIESALMRTIRKIWYENNLIDQCHKNGWNKNLAITLHAYLDSTNYEVFRTLFPEYATEMEVYGEFIQQVVNEMVLKGPAANEQKNTEKKNTESVVSKVANTMLQLFKESNRLDVKNTHADELQRIYFAYVCHVESLEVLLTCASAELSTLVQEAYTTQNTTQDVAQP